jgi:chromosome segregation ATPase
VDEEKKYTVLFDQIINNQSGNHYLYVDSVNALTQGGAVSIVARLYDNNRVRGSQYTESPSIELVTLSREERNEVEKERINKNSNQLSQRSEELNRLKKESKELQAKEGKKWSDVQKQKKLLEEYQEELAKLEEQQEEHAKQLEKQEDTPLTEEEKKLAEILEKLNDPELQEFLQSLEEKAENNELTPEDLEQLGQEMDYQMNQLERLEELYKDVVFQMELDQQIQRVEEAIQKTEES